jgi:hypothetical protein
MVLADQICRMNIQTIEICRFVQGFTLHYLLAELDLRETFCSALPIRQHCCIAVAGGNGNMFITQKLQMANRNGKKPSIATVAG